MFRLKKKQDKGVCRAGTVNADLHRQATPFGRLEKYYFFEKVLQKVFHYREKRGVYGNYDGTV